MDFTVRQKPPYTVAELREKNEEEWKFVQHLVDIAMGYLSGPVDGLAGEGLREAVEHLMDEGYLAFIYRPLKEVAGYTTQEISEKTGIERDHIEILEFKLIVWNPEEGRYVIKN